jgi:hypothetical protein
MYRHRAPSTASASRHRQLDFKTPRRRACRVPDIEACVGRTMPSPFPIPILITRARRPHRPRGYGFGARNHRRWRLGFEMPRPIAHAECGASRRAYGGRTTPWSAEPLSSSVDGSGNWMGGEWEKEMACAAGAEMEEAKIAHLAYLAIDGGGGGGGGGDGGVAAAARGPRRYLLLSQPHRPEESDVRDAEAGWGGTCRTSLGGLNPGARPHRAHH